MTDQPARYRLRSDEEIEAVQWTGHNAEALRAFCGPGFDTIDPEDRAEDPDQDAQLLSDASHWVGLKPGDWVLKHVDHFTATSDEAFRAVWEPAAALPVDRAALRDRIAKTLARTELKPPWTHCLAMADTVLAVLPEPADRAAVLLEAADAVFALDYDVMVGEVGDENFGSMREAWDVGTIHATELLRRLAGETPATTGEATPCGPAPDRCDAEAGEPCANHEREQAHAEGEHCFCGPECPNACTCGSAGDAFIPAGHYRDCPQAAAGARQDGAQK